MYDMEIAVMIFIQLHLFQNFIHIVFFKTLRYLYKTLLFNTFFYLFRVNLEEYVYNGAHNATSTASPDFPFYVSQSWCIVVFTFLIAATIIISLTRSFLFFFLCMRSSMWLHNTMFASITRAVMRFFHTNQSGKNFKVNQIIDIIFRQNFFIDLILI